MNKTKIESAKPGETIKDDQVRGLQLRAFQGRKSFYVYYRANGQQRKPKIGDYPYVTLAQARQIAKEWIGKAVRGEDHSEQRQALRASPTMRDLYDRYMVEHGRFKKSASADKARWENHVIPFMGNAKVKQVTREDINAIHAKLQQTPYAANRVISMLSKSFNLAKS